MQANSKHQLYVIPEARRGAGAVVKHEPQTSVAEQYIMNLMNSVEKDENLRFLTTRVQNFHTVTEARLEGLKQALEAENAVLVGEIAHAMSKDTGKVGAIKMMRLCIGLQMLARREAMDKAKSILLDLVGEYEIVKTGLIGTTA